jgi:adenylate kinase
MRLILLGAPGTGKGTQAALLKEKYDVPHISTGDMFRTAVSEGTAIGLRAKEFIDTGRLVPDDITMGVVRERLEKDDCRERGFMFDGFPRTCAQARGLDKLLEKLGIALDHVVFLQVDVDQIVKRLSGRRTCEQSGRIYNILLDPQAWEDSTDKGAGYTLIQRSDDMEEIVQERLKIYNEQTFPLIRYYEKQGFLRRIDGQGTIEQVFDRIVKFL